MRRTLLFTMPDCRDIYGLIERRRNRMRKLLSVSLIGALALAASVACSARTIQVPQDYPTIQAGVSAAAPGDKVVVEEGTYSEQVDIATPDIELVGEDGAILDGTAFGGA